MIRSLSPHYIETPFVNPQNGITSDAYILEVFIWQGEKLSPPSEPEYSFTIPNPTASTGTNRVNISRVVNDFIDFEPQIATETSVLDGVNSAWVKTQIRYKVGNGTSFAQQKVTELMTRSYYYAMDNQTLDEPIFRTSSNEFKVKGGGVFCIPVLASETEEIEVSVKSYPELSSGAIDLTFTVSPSTNSNTIVKNIWVEVPLYASYVDAFYPSLSGGNEIVLLVTDEWKYSPIQILFQNKLGACEVITFFKERSSNLN